MSDAELAKLVVPEGWIYGGYAQPQINKQLGVTLVGELTHLACGTKWGVAQGSEELGARCSVCEPYDVIKLDPPKFVPRRFYVATSLQRAADHLAMSTALVAAGHRLTYDWTKHGSVQANPEVWEQVAKAETNGVLDADSVVVLLPGGRGTHTELGLALGAKKRVIVVGDQLDPDGRVCIFYFHPRVTRVAERNEDGSLRPFGAIVADVLEAL